MYCEDLGLINFFKVDDDYLLGKCLAILMMMMILSKPTRPYLVEREEEERKPKLAFDLNIEKFTIFVVLLAKDTRECLLGFIRLMKIFYLFDI